MSDLIKAAREAVEALEKINSEVYVNGLSMGSERYFRVRTLCCDAITNLSAAIAEAEKAEPVGKVVEWRGPNSTKEHGFLLVQVIPNKGEVLYPYLGTLLYTHPDLASAKKPCKCRELNSGDMLAFCGPPARALLP